MTNSKLKKFIKDCSNFRDKLERENIKGEFQSIMLKAYMDSYSIKG